METLRWILKNIVLPLTPFLTGALLRFSYGSQDLDHIFDPSELSFSMGLLCIIVLISVNKLTEENLSDALSSILTILIVIFLVLFASSSLIKIHFDTQVLKSYQIFIDNIDTGKIIDTSNLYHPNKDDLYQMLKVLTKFIFGFTFMTVPTVVLFKHLYKLS